MYGFGSGGVLMGLLIIVIIVVVAYFIFKRRGAFGSTSTAETPLEILKKRYAKGEISEEEYEKMKKNLLE